jgi:hypothetical protein
MTFWLDIALYLGLNVSITKMRVLLISIQVALWKEESNKGVEQQWKRFFIATYMPQSYFGGEEFEYSDWIADIRKYSALRIISEHDLFYTIFTC